MARKSRKIEPIQPVVQNTANPIYNTALYLRLSVMDGGRDDSESIGNQQYLLEQFIAGRADFALKNVFIDNGETGVNFNRPAWNDLIWECRQGNINCIVIKDLSRLGRNYIETGDYLERILPMLGVRLIAVNDGYDSLNLSNGERLVTNLKNLVNDIYAKDISRKVIAAMNTMQKNGDFLGYCAAYGYLKDPNNSKKIVVNPDTAPIVRRIYEMKAEGMGNGTICKQLNAEKIPCPLRYRFINGLSAVSRYDNCIWIITTIAEILRNPLYLGHMTQGKTQKALCESKDKRKVKRDEWIIVPNTHEAIIPQELYDRAYAVCEKRTEEHKKRRNKSTRNHNDKVDLLLYGVAFCADCGTALSRRKLNWSAESKAPYAFVCRREIELKACSKKHILETELYNTVYYAIRTQIQKYVDVNGILDRLNQNNDYKSRMARYDAEIEEAEKELRRLSSLRQASYEDYIAKLLTVSEYQFASEKYNGDMDMQQSRLELVIKEKTAYSKDIEHKNKWSATFSRFMDVSELTVEMVQAMVERVEVSDFNRVSVMFKFRDEYDSLMASINELNDDRRVAV